MLTLTKIKSSIPKYRTKLEDNEIAMYFLGQAGFLIDKKNTRIIIDAYLSDMLAKKYIGKELPHIRMITPPIEKENIYECDYVFCSHSHTDHTDNETLLAIQKNNKECKFIIPYTSEDRLTTAGIKKESIIKINACDEIKLKNNINVYGTPSAHEEIKTDENGHNYFLGFIINIESVNIYHSGDCVLYNGLYENIKNKNIDITLLPVNGRSDYLYSKGVLGNFTLKEACDISENIKAKYFIAHHFGMFDFNTIDENKAKDYLLKRYSKNTKYNFLAETEIKYLFKKE